MKKENRIKINRKSEIIIILLIYVVAVLFRAYNAKYINLMTRYWDELIYYDYAKSFVESGFFLVRNYPYDFTRVLYSLILTPIIRTFRDTSYVVNIICYFNAILICSAIFPIYLISKKYINNNIVRIFTVALCATLPIFSICLNILIENIFIPISFWSFYVIYKYYEIPRELVKTKLVYSVLVGSALAVLYACKGIGGFVVVAFAITSIWDMLSEIYLKKEITCIKMKMLYASISGVVFLILYKIYLTWVNYATMALENTDVASNPFDVLTSPDQKIYFFYAICLSITITVIATGIFPMLISLPAIKNFEYAQSRYIVFSYVLTIVNCVMVAFMITMHETPFAFAPPYNYRYCEHFAINFYIFFISIFFDNKSRKISSKNVWILTTVFSILTLSIFQFSVNGVNLQNFGLQFLTNLESLLPKTNEMFGGNFILILFRIIIVVVTLIIVYALIKNNNMSQYAAYGAITIILFYNLFSNNIYNKIYVGIVNSYKVDNKVNEVIAVDKFLRNQGTVNTLLVINEDFKESAVLFDTYMFEGDYTTTQELLKLAAGDDEILDLSCEVIYPPSVMGNYATINGIDYVVTDGSVEVSQSDAEIVDIPDVNSIKVYKLKNSRGFSFETVETSYFPMQIGNSKENDYQNSVLYTDGEVIDSQVISNDNDDCLIYGPYQTITKGKYTIEIVYSYVGDNKDVTEIGSVDLCVAHGQKVLGGMTLNKSDNKVVYDVIVDDDYDDAETRVFAYDEGLVFEKIIITRVE